MPHPGRIAMATDNSKLNLVAVAVGASAGGVEALKDFVSGLPPDLPSAILVVLHVPAEAPSVLARILGRDAALPTAEAVDDGVERTAVRGLSKRSSRR
jgi:two-component system chemotaxis response regulator CheB